MNQEAEGRTTEHIASLAFDEASLSHRREQLEHERVVAVSDIIEWNHFAVAGATGPYHVTLSASDNRVILTVCAESLEKPMALAISLTPLKTIIRDYFLICESYFEAVRLGNLARIEAIDMSRRGLHNEGAQEVALQLAGKVTMDSETARRFFTLICVLHLK